VDSRVEAQGRTQALSWGVQRIRDQFGNFISFTYDEDPFLVQFRAYLGSRSSHIGSHIVEFYNVKAGARQGPAFFVWEDDDEEMGPAGGFIYGGVPGTR
jgi:hypothetical protein